MWEFKINAPSTTTTDSHSLDKLKFVMTYICVNKVIFIYISIVDEFQHKYQHRKMQLKYLIGLYVFPMRFINLIYVLKTRLKLHWLVKCISYRFLFKSIHCRLCVPSSPVHRSTFAHNHCSQGLHVQRQSHG